MAHTAGTLRRSRTRRLFRRVVQAFAVLLGVVALLAVIAVAASQTTMFRTWLREQVVTRANASLNGHVSIGGLAGNLLGSLELTDLAITMDNAEVIAMKRMAATYSLRELISNRRLVLNKVAVDDLRLHLVEDEHGWNAARLVPPSATVEGKEAQAGPTLAVTMDDFTVQNGSLDVTRSGASYTLRQIALEGTAKIDAQSRRIDLKTLSFVMPDRDVHVEKLAGQIQLDSDGTFTADELVLKTAASSLRAHARITPNAYDARADIDRISADEIHRILGDVPPATDLWGTVHAQGPASAVALDGTALKSDAGALTLAGTIAVADQPYGYDLRIVLDHLDAAALLGPAQPKTNLSGTVTAKGKGISFDQAVGAFSVALNDSTLRDTTFDQLSAHGTLDDRRLAVDALAKTNLGAATVAAKVNVPTQQYDVRLTAEQFDPTPFLNRKDISAHINGTVSATGTGFAPKTATADAQFALTPSDIAAIQVRKLDAAIHLGGSQLTVTRFDLDSNVATAHASGSTAIDSVIDQKATAASGQLHYDLTVSDLRPLARLANAGPMEGSFSLNGTASGRLDALDVDSTLTAKRLTASGARIAALRAQLKARAIGTPHASADVTAQADELQASGRRAAAAQVDASWKQETAEQSAATIGLHVRQDDKHTHAVHGRAEITPRENRVLLDTVTLQIGNDTWKNAGVSRIVRRGERVAISGLELHSNGGVVTISGEGGTRGAEDVAVNIRGLDIAPFVTTQQGEVQGRISARAHLGGSAQNPQVDAEIGLDQLTVEKVAYQSARSDLHLRDGSATVNGRVVQSGDNQFVLDARLPLRTSLSPFRFEMGEALSGTARASNIDIAFLDPVLTQVSELRGFLNADLALSGSLRKPQVHGPLSITQGHAYVVPLGLKYDPIELRARLDGSALQIDTLHLVSGGGSLSGGGSAELGGQGLNGQAVFTLKNFPLFQNEHGEGRASGWLSVGGSTQAPIVAGSIQTDRLVFKIPEKLPGAARPPDPTIIVVGPNAAESLAPAVAHVNTEKQEAPPPAIADRATLHIDVDVPHNAWLRRSDADIELRGWTTTWKKPDQPLRVAGEIEAVRGWYTFQGKKFRVEEGQVTLTGQDFDPLLNVVAVYQVDEYTVRLRIGGKLTQPTLKLESDPALQQADILSVVLFGKPANKLNQGESKGLRDSALSVAGGYVASEFRQSVADALGVDNLEVEPGAAGLAGSSASVGKYVSEDIFVSLSHKFAQQNIEQLSIEYFLTQRWMLQTATDTQGNSGIDIFWRRKY